MTRYPKPHWLRLCVLALALLPFPAPAQEAGSVLKDDTLRAEPYADAKPLADLRKGEQVTILQRASGWYQVRVGSTQGWVRMLSVRRGEPAKTGAAAEVGGVAALATGRAGTGQIVSTTGVRGLSEEELKGARFDEAQLKKAESFAVSRADAQTFAADAPLRSRQFDYLPAPAPRSAGTAQGGRQ
jgi:hypothetical protein